MERNTGNPVLSEIRHSKFRGGGGGYEAEDAAELATAHSKLWASAAHLLFEWRISDDTVWFL